MGYRPLHADATRAAGGLRRGASPPAIQDIVFPSADTQPSRIRDRLLLHRHAVQVKVRNMKLCIKQKEGKGIEWPDKNEAVSLCKSCNSMTTSNFCTSVWDASQGARWRIIHGRICFFFPFFSLSSIFPATSRASKPSGFLMQIPGGEPAVLLYLIVKRHQ